MHALSVLGACNYVSILCSCSIVGSLSIIVSVVVRKQVSSPKVIDNGRALRLVFTLS